MSGVFRALTLVALTSCGEPPTERTKGLGADPSPFQEPAPPLNTPPATPSPSSAALTHDAVQILVEGHGLLHPGERVQAGDRLQVILPAGHGSDAWLSDGPDDLLGNFPLHADRPTLSPFALDVDDEKDDEQLLIVLSHTPLRRRVALRALQGEMLDGVTVVRVVIPKAH